MSEVIQSIRNPTKQLIFSVCKNYQPFNELNIINKIKIVNYIEKSIVSAALDRATSNNIPAYWEDQNFISVYSGIGYHILSNLDVNSSVNSNKRVFIKTYLIGKVVEYIVFLDLKKYVLKKNNLPNDVICIIKDYIGVLDLKNIGYMTSIQLNPYINQIYLTELAIRSLQTIKNKFSNLHTCPECGGNKSVEKPIQTRSLDEGQTLFITCQQCNYTWTQY